MASRSCSSCHTDLPKSEYSKNQWTKKDSKCKGCVAGGGGDGGGATAANTNTTTTNPAATVTKDELFVSIGDVHVAGDGKEEDAAAAAEWVELQSCVPRVYSLGSSNVRRLIIVRSP